MQKDILKFIESQGGVFKAAKFFGGINQLLKLVKNDTELYNKILSDCSGKIFFYSDSGQRHEFDILVTGFDVESIEQTTKILNVSFDLQVKSKKFEKKIADWVQSYADDIRLTYYLNNPLLKKFDYVQGFITSVNGKDYDDAPNPDFPIPDDEVEPLLKENIIPYIKKIQNLFD